MVWAYFVGLRALFGPFSGVFWPISSSSGGGISGLFGPVLDDLGHIMWGFVPYLGLSREILDLIWPSSEGANFGDWGADIGDFGSNWPSLRGYPCLI